MTIDIIRYKLIKKQIVTIRDVIFDVHRVQMKDEEIFLYDKNYKLMNSKEEERLFTYNCDYTIHK